MCYFPGSVRAGFLFKVEGRARGPRATARRMTDGDYPHSDPAYKQTDTVTCFLRFATALCGPTLLERSLNPAHEYEDENDNDDQSESAGRIVSPAGTIGPRRQRADENQDQDNQKNGSKHTRLPSFVKIGSPALRGSCIRADGEPSSLLSCVKISTARQRCSCGYVPSSSLNPFPTEGNPSVVLFQKSKTKFEKIWTYGESPYPPARSDLPMMMLGTAEPAKLADTLG